MTLPSASHPLRMVFLASCRVEQMRKRGHERGLQMVILFSKLTHDVQNICTISGVVSQRTIVAILLRLEKGHPQQEHRRSTSFVEFLVQLFLNCLR